MARQVLENGVILPAEYSDDWYDDMTSNLTKLDDVIGSDSEKLSSADVGAAALSNSYNDLDNLPTIPTKTSDLTNDSNFVDTSNSAVSSGITSAKVTAYDSHVADTDIHVTTADKQKWNDNVNQSYVLRYASTSVTPSSTIAYSVLNNTDNIKAGDSVIDSAGKVFLIASVDSANQTVTVSAVLLTLALDANVMHLSGDETKSGELTLSATLKSSDIVPLTNLTFNLGSPDYKYNNVYAYTYTSIGRYFGNEANSNQRTNITLYANRDTQNKSCAYITRFRQNRAQGALQTGDLQMIGFDVLENEVRTNNVFSIQCTDWLNDVPQKVNFISYAKSYSFGHSTRKALLNGINPGALSFPDLNNGIDISGYLTTGNSNNTYTPPVDGYVSVNIGIASGGCAVFLSQGDLYNACYSATGAPDVTGVVAWCVLPVKGGVQMNIGLKGGNNYINSAKFFPCQGNV